MYGIIINLPDGGGNGGGGDGGSSVPPPVTDNSNVAYTLAQLHNTYPNAKSLQLVYLPNVPVLYTKIDDNPNGVWLLSPIGVTQ